MNPGLGEIFLTFARVSAISFGGVNYWLRRALVDEKRWISNKEYAETFALGQLIPGPNIYNLAVLIGHRFGGAAGATLAAAGLMLPPLVFVLAIGLAYQHYGTPVFERAIAGMTPVAAGLVLANGVTLAMALPRRPRTWVFLACALASVGMLRWPLVAVMALLAPLAIGLAWREAKDERKGGPEAG